MSWFKKTSWKLVLLTLFLLPITGFADEVVIDYKNMSATELAEMVRNKEVTSEYLVQEAYKVIKEENPKLNAVIGLREAEALEEARNIEDIGQPFLGVPILVKGLGHTVKGMPNSNGFPFAKDQLAGSNGSFVKALQSAGFIILGQTNYPEMGWRNITDSALYGPTGSPWNPNYQAGGSSGGAGASVASGMNPIASGSDAGGSIRIPASWNGIVGLKPSRGVIKANSTSSKGQVVHFANTRDMTDTKLLFEALRNEKVSIKDTAFSKDLKIAYSTESPVGTPVTQDAVDAVNQAVAFLRSQGFDVVEAKPEIDGIKLMENYYTIAASSAGVAEYLGNQILKRPITIEDVDILTWALYQTGKVTSKEEVNEAWDFSHEAQAVMENFHQSYPIYLTPTTASTAPLVGDPLITPENLRKMSEIDQMEAPDRKKLIYDQWLDALTYTPYTQLANLTGEPALSLPTFVSSNGLPLGIQLNAATGEDWLLLEFGQLFEDNKQFKLLKQEEEVPEESTDSSSSESEVPEESTDSSSNESGSVEESSNSSTKESSEKDTTPSSSKEEIKKTDSTNNSHNKQKKKLESSNTSSPSTQSLPKTGEKKIVLLPVIGVILLVLLGIFVLFKKKNK